MKKFTLALIPFLLLACASQKNTKNDISGNYTIQSDCPTEGTCTLQVLKDKSLLIQNDNLGRPYYRLQDTPGKTVVIYTYAKKKNPIYQDDIYSEEVVFDTDSDLNALKKGINAKDANLVFGVKCFCKGKAGYYRPQTGSAQYKNNTLYITLPADVIDNQLIKEVQVSFKQ